MIMVSLRDIACITALCISCAACAPNTIYRHNFSDCNATTAEECATNSIVNYFPGQDNEFHLGYVEFDDQGQLRDRAQLETLLTNYSGLAAESDVIVTVFVHGWHHSAAQDDNNVDHFKALLEKVARNEKLMSKMLQREERKILGVYVGWRGDSITIPVIEHATFWDRKEVAHDVGLQGVTEVLLRLEEITNVKIGQEEEPRPQNSRLITIGHSFGGAVVFTALQQVLADRFVDSHRNKTYVDDAKGFGDLVLLVNPAFEAMRYSTLYDIAQQDCRPYALSKQLPRLLILTSEQDDATGMIFPLGRFFSTVMETHQELPRYECTATGKAPVLLDEFAADKTAVGHFKPFQTHYMKPREQKSNLDQMQHLLSLQDQWESQTYNGTLEFSQIQLQHLGKTRPLNPYLNIYVDEKIIPNHNDIWDEQVVSFIQELFLISTNNETPPEKKAPASGQDKAQ
jgi:hypothetical protein